MRKYLSLALLSSILFLFASCGMPTYHNFSDEIRVSSYNSSVTDADGVVHRYDLGFSVSFTELADGGALNDMDSASSPSILVMYSLNPRSYADNLASRFNSIIRNSSSYYNGLSADFTNGQLDDVSYTADGAEINLYGFSDASGSSLFETPLFTIDEPLDWKNFPTWYFMFDCVTDDDGFHVIMEVWRWAANSSPELVDSMTKKLYRPFSSQMSFPTAPATTGSVADYSYYAHQGNEDETYTLNLYLTCNVRSGGGGFNNIYWSALTDDSIDVSTITSQ